MFEKPLLSKVQFWSPGAVGNVVFVHAGLCVYVHVWVCQIKRLMSKAYSKPPSVVPFLLAAFLVNNVKPADCQMSVEYKWLPCACMCVHACVFCGTEQMQFHFPHAEYLGWRLQPSQFWLNLLTILVCTVSPKGLVQSSPCPLVFCLLLLLSSSQNLWLTQ